MTQPAAYNRAFNFTNFELDNPTSPKPGDSLDEEFSRIKTTTDQIRVNLAIIQRDDTELANESVGVDQLKDELRGYLVPPTTETDVPTLTYPGLYGAIGDGVTDDTAALTAMDAVAVLEDQLPLLDPEDYAVGHTDTTITTTSLDTGAITSTSVDDTANLFTKAAHGLVTGQPIVPSASNNGFVKGGVYFAYVASSSTFGVATTRANALAGTTINFTGTTNTTWYKGNIGKTAHGFETANKVQATTTANGLTADVDYYVYKLDADAFLLASSRAGAYALSRDVNANAATYLVQTSGAVTLRRRKDEPVVFNSNVIIPTTELVLPYGSLTIDPTDDWVNVLKRVPRDAQVNLREGTYTNVAQIELERPIYIQAESAGNVIMEANFLVRAAAGITFEDVNFKAQAGKSLFTLSMAKIALNSCAASCPIGVVPATNAIINANDSSVVYFQSFNRQCLWDYQNMTTAGLVLVGAAYGCYIYCSGGNDANNFNTFRSNSTGSMFSITGSELYMYNTLVWGKGKTSGGVGVLLQRSSKARFEQNQVGGAQMGIYEHQSGIQATTGSEAFISGASNSPSYDAFQVINCTNGITPSGGGRIKYETAAGTVTFSGCTNDTGGFTPTVVGNYSILE